MDRNTHAPQTNQQMNTQETQTIPYFSLIQAPKYCILRMMDGLCIVMYEMTGESTSLMRWGATGEVG